MRGCAAKNHVKLNQRWLYKASLVWRLAMGVTIAAGTAGLIAPAPPAHAGGQGGVPWRRPKDGDILKIFDKGRVYVVTNSDPALADVLLEGVNTRERHILTPQEWADMPAGIRQFASVIFLTDRENLPDNTRLPDRCDPTGDTLYTEVVRTKHPTATTSEVIISAPDAGWLKYGIAKFREKKEAPRRPDVLTVHSTAVVALTREAEDAARRDMRGGVEFREYSALSTAHLVPPPQVVARPSRYALMNEVVLIDRSAPPCREFAPTLDTLTSGKTIALADTVVWREKKPGGLFRAVISAPTAHQIGFALRKFSDNFAAVPEQATVIASARDLRSVRRIAVAGVKSDGIAGELSRRLSSRAASEMRNLNAFEVVERAGLSEMLGEVALGQAGITRGNDRARVRQFAAADALLLVDVTDISRRTEYSAAHKRVTPNMGNAPQKPAEPSRLKVNLGGLGDGVQALAEAALKKAVGTKSDEEYEADKKRYNEETLPKWQRQVEQYNWERSNRQVSWEQTVTAKSHVVVSGSLRMVDLTDGLVLWEAPFTATDDGESRQGVSNITVTGEDNRPVASDLPAPRDAAPANLVTRCADCAIVQGVEFLPVSALLPTVAVSTSTGGDTSGEPVAVAPVAPTGKILDVDGDALLIGLGASDGVKLGDMLVVTVSEGAVVRAKVTRVRPRTCDADIAQATGVSLRARLGVGLVVKRDTAPPALSAPPK